jgi:hypothetical protein
LAANAFAANGVFFKRRTRKQGIGFSDQLRLMKALAHIRGIAPSLGRSLCRGLAKHAAGARTSTVPCRLSIKNMGAAKQYQGWGTAPSVHFQSHVIKSLFHSDLGPLSIRLFHSTSWVGESEKENGEKDVNVRLSHPVDESKGKPNEEDQQSDDVSTQEHDDSPEAEKDEGEEVLKLCPVCRCLQICPYDTCYKPILIDSISCMSLHRGVTIFACRWIVKNTSFPHLSHLWPKHLQSTNESQSHAKSRKKRRFLRPQEANYGCILLPACHDGDRLIRNCAPDCSSLF